MAKATLPTNYQDDVLKSTMGGKRRYTFTDNSDGTKCLEDATQYDKVGSNFGAADINKTNAAVNAAADASKIMENVDDIAANTQAGYMMGALAGKQLIQNLGGCRFGTTVDGKPGYKKAGADTVYPFSTPTIISMIQLLPGLNNYAGNVITLDVTEKNKLHIDTMQSWYDDANISIDADGTVLFSKKHQTGGSNRVDTTNIGDIDISQYSLITINFSVVSKNGQGWGKLNNIVIS